MKKFLYFTLVLFFLSVCNSPPFVLALPITDCDRARFICESDGSQCVSGGIGGNVDARYRACGGVYTQCSIQEIFQVCDHSGCVRWDWECYNGTNPGWTKEWCNVCNQTAWSTTYECNSCNGLCPPL
jgi:hypothetical protein